MRQHRTARGKEFNMQAFADSRGDSIAVGNSGRNARGDLIGPGGKVLATSQEIANRVHDTKNKVNSAKVKLNPLDQEVSRKEIIGADGVARWEITYADGSMEVVVKEDSPIEFLEKREPKSKKKKTIETDTGESD